MPQLISPEAPMILNYQFLRFDAREMDCFFFGPADVFPSPLFLRAVLNEYFVAKIPFLERHFLDEHY